MDQDASGAPSDSPEPTPEQNTGSTARLVWNPFLGVYLAQSPMRMQRRELTSECPFCADLTSGRVAQGTQAWIRPNDFPPLLPPQGEAYILIYSADHDQTFAGLDVAGVVRVIGLWRQIYADLSARYPCVMTWETSGEAIGQTQRHPHGQTYGLSVLPDVMVREMEAVERSERDGAVCPFCAELRAEAEGPRVLFSGENWLAFVPAYARYPYQVHLLPREHFPSVAGVEEEAQTEELARMLLSVIRACNRVFEAPMPYMLALHQLADPRYHFHIELLPVGRAPGKLKLAASSEAAWGFWLNDALPEVKAAELRAAIAEDTHDGEL
jgi:UDPglucose--hexose-1-phosphate uridylyltransferase